MDYPETHEIEREIILQYGRKLDEINLSEKVLDSLVTLVRSTREEPWDKEMDQGASVRAALALYEKVHAYAWLEQSGEATLDHIKKAAISTMAGRIKTSPESKYYDDPIGLIEELLEEVLKGS
jgi:MoxR-like ATPase